LLLSTMLADAGIGEWGFSALVEADGRHILFDTGARPDTVLHKARELGIDLAGVFIEHTKAQEIFPVYRLRELTGFGGAHARSAPSARRRI
jgi:hypothetical protein